MVGGLAGICRVVFGTRWSGPAACAWPNRLRVEMPARSQRCQRFMRPQIVAKNVQKSKWLDWLEGPGTTEVALGCLPGGTGCYSATSPDPLVQDRDPGCYKGCYKVLHKVLHFLKPPQTPNQGEIR